MNRKSRDAKKALVVQLRGQALSWESIASIVGVASNSILNWRRNDERFRKACEVATKGAVRGLVEHNLYELAKGAKEEETIDKYMVTRLDKNGNEQLVERTHRIKYKPPSEKALGMLAHKYAKGEYESNKDKEITHTIRITQQNRSLSIEERKELLANEGSEVIEVDYKELRTKLEEEALEEGVKLAK